MQLKQQGFTLFETLLALALSSVFLLGAARLFPTLQQAVLQQYQQMAIQESLWHLAFSIGKQLQRAGYCRGQCSGEGLQIQKNGECLLVSWDSNSNGKWEPSGHPETELTGFRLRNGSIETLRGATSCEGNAWERISDPNILVISHFSVIRKPRKIAPPLMMLTLIANLKTGGPSITQQHFVVGHNL